MPQAEAPIWRETVSRFADAKKTCSEPFPEYIGVLASVVSSGESGLLESPHAMEVFGRSVFVPKALLVGIAVGDTIACNIRLNGKGNPQVAEPVFKMCEAQVPRPRLLSPSDIAVCLESTGKPLPEKHIQGVFEADWCMFPAELVPHTLAAAGPAALSRAPAVCKLWSQAIVEAQEDLEGFWKALCAENYPGMTAKIVVDMTAGEVHAPVCQSWKQIFMQRHLKQLHWDSEKRDQRQLKQLRLERQQGQLAVQDKERGQNAAKARRGQERQQSSTSKGEMSNNDTQLGGLLTAPQDRTPQGGLRAVREKKCRRCGEKYMPGLNELDSCRWHRGQYLPVGSDGEHGGAANQSACSSAANKKVQQLLKTNSGKKKSKQHSVGIHALSGGESVDWAWSCCGATNMVELGCASGPHS